MYEAATGETIAPRYRVAWFLVSTTATSRWKPRFLLSLLSVSYLCGVQTGNTADFDECGIESAMAFEEWQEWNTITPERVKSLEHRDWIDIHVDDLARNSDLTNETQYAECAKIVKVHYERQFAADAYRLMLMVKMPAGFDPDNGDWWYGMYDRSVETSVIEQGIIVNCVACHKRASGTDYVFSTAVTQ